MLHVIRKFSQSTAVSGVHIYRRKCSRQRLSAELANGASHMVHQAVLRVRVQVQIVLTKPENGDSAQSDANRENTIPLV